MKDRVVELINQIGLSLDSPYYASKILTECGKEILEIIENLEKKTVETRKIYYFNVYSGNGYLSDGVVIANNETDAMEKIKKKYSSPYLKIELDYESMGSDCEDNGIKEDENIVGLFVRWED